MSDQVTRLFAAQQPTDPAPAVTPEFVAQARAIAAICASRMLLMIAVVTGAAIWLWVAYTPTDLRLYVAIAYSLVFVLPQTALYLRRG